MKKYLLILIVWLTSALGANAQGNLYFGGSIGGNFGLGSHDNTTISILPEIGYRFNQMFSVGTTVGYEYEKDDDYKSHAFVFSPYLRCVFVRTTWINVFIDGVARLRSTKVVDYDTYTTWRAGIRPGVSINLSPNVSFVATVGFLGYEHNSDSLHKLGFSDKSGFDLSTDNVSIGFCVGF